MNPSGTVAGPTQPVGPATRLLRIGIVCCALVAGCAAPTSSTPAPSPAVPTAPAPPPLPPGVPHSGSVGFRGDVSALTVLDPSGPAPDGARWSSGLLEIMTDDLTLDHVLVKGGVDYYGNGTLTVRNSVIEGNNHGFAPLLGRGGHLAMTDTTLRWTGPPPGGKDWGDGVVGGAWTMNIARCDLSGAPDGIDVAAPSTIEQNDIHGLALLGVYPHNTHNDGIQSFGGPGLVVRNNRIDIRSPDGRASDGVHQNGAVFIQPVPGSPSISPQIVGNYLAGGSITVRLEGPMRGAVVTDNVLAPPVGAYTDVEARTGVQIATWTRNFREKGGTIEQPAPIAG